MAIASRSRNRKTRRTLSLLLAIFCFQLVSANASAQANGPSRLLSRLTSQRTSVLKASFAYSPRFPKQGQAVQFVESSSGNPTSWTWDFGDGTGSTERNPSHIYATSGFRKVTLTVSTGTSSKKASRTVTILPDTANATFVFSPTSPGPGQTVQFADTTPGNPISWQWDFGDGGTSSVKNPSHAYSRTGTFAVTLVAGNSSGTKRGTQPITVAEMSVLSASFIYTPSAPLANISIQFTDTSTGSPTAWLWNFGDGMASTAHHPIHVYTTAGSKTVTLTVTNGTGSNVATQTVTVGAALAASFSFSPSSPVSGQSIQFTDMSTGSPTSWSWNFGDGSTSTLRNPSHSYTTAGSKTVTLTVANGTGSNTATQTVMVGVALAASFSYSPSSPVAGQSIQFTDISTGTPTSWLWNFGDGSTSASQHPVHTYTTAGSKTVTLNVTNSTGSKSTSRTVTVLTALTASFTFSPASPAVGQSVQFSDTSIGTPSIWQWNFGDGTTSVAQNPAHGFAAAGSYTVTLTIMNGSTSNTTSQTVMVGATLAASFTFSPTSPTTGQTVQFTDTSTGAPTSWSWNFGDGSTSTTRNPSHTYTTASSKTVTLTVTNASGSNTTTRTVTVAAAVTASFTFSPTSPTTGQTVQFTDTSTGAPTSWSWNFGDGSTSTTRNPSHTYANAGTYTVSLTAATSLNANTASMQVSVAPAATLEASFTFSPSSPAPNQNVAFTDTSTGTPNTWQWNFGDGGTSTLRNPSHSYAAEGLYTITLIAENSTGSDTVSRAVSVEQTTDILSADRLYDWASYCGVPGGIPNRTTVYTTLSPGATAAQISAAIASCPPGQVVFLSAGTYNMGSGQIVFPYSSTGVTLRGAGAGQTIITSTRSNVIANTYRYFVGDSGINVLSGHTKGSTSITLASTPAAYMTTGSLLVITEEQSPNKFAPGIGTYARDGLSSGLYSNVVASRSVRYVTRIASVSGNRINLATPIPIDFSASLNVRAYPQNANGVMSLCGVEDLTLYACADPIRWYHTDRCWVKGVEFSNSTDGDIGSLQLNSSFQIEVRRCYFHDVAGYPNQSDGIAVGVNYGVCNGLFIDNVAYRTSAMFEINGAAANAFLYNYAWDTARAGNQVACPFPFIYHHGPHTMMNLFEGNIGDNFLNDGYHGSGSHAVLFRNQFHGLHPSYVLYRRMVVLPRGSYYHSVVGNVLGDSSWAPASYEAAAGNGSTTGHIYSLGFPNGLSSSLTPETSWSTFAGTYPDAFVGNTLIRHGNYDYFNKIVVWDSSIASRSIPDSLFYSSKPAFFGSLQWPPIGPDVSGLTTRIPAKARWDAYMSSGRLTDLLDD